MPVLEYLSEDEAPEVRKALLNQFIGLVAMINENLGELGYQTICQTVFPLIDKLLYDEKEDVRDKAIYVLSEIRHIVKEDWKDNVLRLILCMAHDEKDNIKESAVKLLNEVAPDMGQEMNEGVIVNELRGLGSIEEASGVKCTIV